jgi:hypothetical protein
MWYRFRLALCRAIRIAKTIMKIAQTGVHEPAQLSALAINELEIR